MSAHPNPDWRGARVAVTGATGFLGSHLVSRLLARGAHVTGISRRASGRAEPGLAWLQADLRNAVDAQRALQSCRPDLVFHLASQADGRPDRSLVVPIMEAEVNGTVHLLLAASELQVGRVVLAGSLEEPEAGAVPQSPYAAAKAAARMYARMFERLYGLPVVTARIFMAYGPGQPDWKLIPSAAAALLRGEAPAISSPQRAVDWIYVDDVIDGLLRLGRVPGVDGLTIDLGSGELTTIHDLLELLRSMIPDAPPCRYGAGAARPHEREVCADARSTAALLGWQARIPLADGLARTLAALPRSPERP